MIATFMHTFGAMPSPRHRADRRIDWTWITVLYPGIFEERRAGFDCLDCRKDTFELEYYMVHAALWHSVVPHGQGMLCFDCLEARLSRKLSRADFTPVPINRAHLSNPRFA